MSKKERCFSPVEKGKNIFSIAFFTGIRYNRQAFTLYKPLGHRQAVRHSTLTAALEGSNPAGPAERKRAEHFQLEDVLLFLAYSMKCVWVCFYETKNTRANALVFFRFDSGFYDLIGNRTRVYAVRGRRLNRLTMRPESRRQDSNLRPLRPERSALPNSATPRSDSNNIASFWK